MERIEVPEAAVSTVATPRHLHHKPFCDQTTQRIDAKGRLVLPSPLRSAFGDGGRIMALDGTCLGLWTEHSFGLFEARLHRRRQQQLSGKGPRRAVFAATSMVSPDSQGRFVIPERLRQAVHLESDVVVVGNLDHLEIWSQAAWEPVRADGEAMLQLELETDSGPDPEDVW